MAVVMIKTCYGIVRGNIKLIAAGKGLYTRLFLQGTQPIVELYA